MNLNPPKVISKVNPNIPSKVLSPKKSEFFFILNKAKLLLEFYKIFVNYYIFFYLILISFPYGINSYNYYISLQFNQPGLQQVLGDNFADAYPAEVYVDDSYNYLTGNKIQIPSINSRIILGWNSLITNFDRMFSDLKNITEVYISGLIGYNSIFTYTFSNCVNLRKITISISYDRYCAIQNMKGMFYNCQSLLSFSFDYLYLDYYDYIYSCSSCSDHYYRYYHDIDMSYMFYNCTSLKNITTYHIIQYVTDMNHMFYNCISLTSINLNRFITRDDFHINFSYLFYNCNSLARIDFNSTHYNFYVSDIKFMFYNCSKLNQISYLNYFKTTSTNYYDMSYLFYNCQSLREINLIYNTFYVSNTKEMFYNCIELTSINFNPYRTIDNINMTKMFYNCNKLSSIELYNSDGYSYFNPNDMSSMFYNCYSLTSIDLNKFRTNNVQNMSYLFYNCKCLTVFYRLMNRLENTNVKNMRGLFQNCEAIVTLDLTNFFTPNVEIMWDMFNGCTSLIDLYIPNFVTTNVIDMQSMFDGCKNLISLNLNHFNTMKVQYMNKMFQNCENLKHLNMSQLYSDSLSSMYRMFYNCNSLVYLNIFSLIEDVQSITEMFDGTSDNFELCIKDKENIPNIFDSIFDKIKRDCSSNCYGVGNERIKSTNEKRCCPKYEYNNECYNNCPSKTKIKDSSKRCQDFNCVNFYNYEQDDCDDTIPDGFYQNDTLIHTIDKCHKDCKTCNAGPNENSANCLICNNDKPYLYLGNCYTNCRYGNFIDNGIKQCICHKEKCKECTIDSLKYDLCVSCNKDKGYYEILNDINNIYGFKKCYKDPEEYYLNLTQKKYLPCYHSCKFCLPYKPDKQNHYCTSCNEDNNYPIKDEKNSSLMNCYPKCKYNYYFNSSDDYICIDTPGCPSFEQQKNSLHKGIEPLFPPFGRGVLTTRLMENLFFLAKKNFK